MQICLELAIASPASRVDPIFEAEHLSVLFVSSSLVAQRQFPSDTVLRIFSPGASLGRNAPPQRGEFACTVA
jgi:hypothetical protein